MTGNAFEIINFIYQYIKDEEKLFDVAEHKEKKQKRSLSANAYCWVLLQKLADKLGTTKEELYTKYIQEKGIFRAVRVNNEAVGTICYSWQNQGLGWLYEIISKDDNMTDLLLYYGSSSYNTSQMATFVDYIVEECKLQEIETLSDKEIESLKNSWNK